MKTRLILLAALCIALPQARALTYGEWIAQYPALTGGAADMLADPDGDGRKNLVEYALAGANPTVQDAMTVKIETFFQDQAPDNTWGEPVIGGRMLPPLAPGSKRALGIRWQPRPGIEGIRIVPQADNRSLVNWLWGESAITRWDAGGYTYARFNSEEEVWGNQFMRLTVEVAD